MKKSFQWLLIPSMLAMFAIASGCKDKNDGREKSRTEHRQKKESESKTQKRCGSNRCRCGK